MGTGTVLADDPALTARDADGELLEEQPIPVVFGRREVPLGAALERHLHEAIRMAGADLAADLAELQRRGIRSLFIEGGPTLASCSSRQGSPTRCSSTSPGTDRRPRTAIDDVGVATIGDALRYATSPTWCDSATTPVVARGAPPRTPTPTRERA